MTSKEISKKELAVAKLALSEARHALQRSRDKCWHICGEASRFSALAQALERRGILSTTLLHKIQIECEQAIEDVKDAHATKKVRHLEFIATLPKEAFPFGRRR